MTRGFSGKDIISINDLSKDEIVHILETAKRMESNAHTKQFLSGKVMGSLFFEPSTRTRLSFESAAQRLGARVVGFADPNVSSAAKGETIHDTAIIVEKYCDVMVIRHPNDGAARAAADAARVPVINAGDGANQHPTQTLLDLYTIKKTQRKISGLHVAMVGDLKYGRTVHSLASALAKFGCTLYFVSPEALRMPAHLLDQLKEAGIPFSEHLEIGEVIGGVDILYMTRIQKERFPDPIEYERVKDAYILTVAMLRDAKPSMKVLHPLPRVNEIAPEVDSTKHAHYFEQAANGLWVRQALLCLTTGVVR